MVNEWVVECQKGQVSAYAKIVRTLQEPVVRFLYRMVNNQHTAEELGQDAFLKAYQQLHRFDARRASFKTWLYTIARNLCIDYLRKQKARYVDMDEAGPLPDESGVNPFERMSEEDAAAQIARAIHSLEPIYREVFILKEFEACSVDEIAEIAGIESGTVKSRLYRARAQLQIALAPLLQEMAGTNHD